MANMRLTPPGDNSHEPLLVNGRTYSCAVGSTVDVQDFDAAVLLSNGWINTGGDGCLVGTTAQRPVFGRYIGRRFLDTTIGAIIIWVGGFWTHSVTGGNV